MSDGQISQQGNCGTVQYYIYVFQMWYTWVTKKRMNILGIDVSNSMYSLQQLGGITLKRKSKQEILLRKTAIRQYNLELLEKKKVSQDRLAAFGESWCLQFNLYRNQFPSDVITQRKIRVWRQPKRKRHKDDKTQWKYYCKSSSSKVVHCNQTSTVHTV